MFATERNLPVALWIDTPALGDTIAAIPTLRKLSKAFEDKPLTVFTSNPSLFDGHPLVYQALDTAASKEGYKVYHTFWPLVGKTYDLTGSSVEFRHSNTDIRQFHAMSLGFSLAHDELEMELYCEQEYELPFTDYVIIHPTHTWPTRTWSQEKWQELVDRLNAKGIPVVAIGKDSSEVGTFNVQKPVMNVDIKLGVNLLNNPEINIAVLRWMMNHRAKAVVTMDSGILHVAGTTDIEIIQLGSSIDWRLRAPWRKGTQDYKYNYIAGGCDIMCTSNMKYNSRVHGSIHGVPPQIKCLENKPTFECHPTVDQVYNGTIKLYGYNNLLDKAYITHTTSNYEEVTINLVNSIKEFSKIPMVVFTIDYDASDELKALATCYRIDMNLPALEDSDFHDTNGNMYVNRDRFRTYMALSSKIDAMILACDFINEWVYLDGDCIANYNVDDLFDYMDQIGTYPLATLGPHQYVMITGDDSPRGNPFDDEGHCDNTKCLEWPLMSYFGMRPEQRTYQYKTTNILVGNKDTKPFLKYWAELRTELPTKVDPLVYMPFHEETIYNVLVWQQGNKHLPMVYVNTEGPETVEHFFNTIVEGDVLFSDFYRLTSEKHLIKVFHGEKRRESTEQMIKIIKKNMSQKKKLLYLAPHLSTGGMPQFVQTRVEAMIGDPDFDVYLLEYNQYSDDFVVQRNRITRLLGDKFRTIAQLNMVSDEIRARRMQEIISEIKPDIIHIEESPESFDSFNRIPTKALDWLYAADKPWRIIETCHNIWFKSETKQYLPTGMMYCTPYHPTDNFKQIEPLIESAIVEYPIIKLYPDVETKLAYKNKYEMDPAKIHVLNTGLWTAGKNQGEGVEIARIAEEQYPGKFHFHFVGNQASNFKSYWEPIMANVPANVTIWGERNDTDKLMMAADAFMFNSTWECSPLALREAISYGLVTFARNLPQYMDTFTPYIIPFTNDLEENASILIERLTDSKENFGTFTPPEDDFARFINQHRDFYKHVMASPIKNGKYNPEELGVPASIEARLTHPGVIRLNVDSVGPGEWSAEFLDGDEVVHVATGLKANCWYSPVRKWHTDWRVRILCNGIEHTVLRWQLEGKEVAVQFSSASLGDTLSWVGQMIRFKKAHKIQKLIVATYKNWLFDQEAYAKLGIHFVGVSPEHQCRYEVGVFFNKEEPWRNWEHKYDWRTVPLGKIAADRLGILYKEERPILAKEYTNARANTVGMHVVIATQSTAQAKYWNNPTGWKELTDYYISKGIQVKHASKEGKGPIGSQQLPEALTDVAGWINTSLHFVGISSGLSWFAWALGKEVVMISGFTDPYVEFQDRVEFVNNHQVCHGCWGSRVFDRGDWNWCPDFKDTKRQHECSKEISAQQVIDAAEKLMQTSYIQL